MKPTYALLAAALLILLFAVQGNASVEWTPTNTYGNDKPIKDAAVSVDGKWIYLLTGDGNIFIYHANGALRGKIAVGNHIDGIQAGPQEGQLFLTNLAEGLVREISLTFIEQIDIAGAPFIGAEEAPIVIAVFLDYQCPYCARLMPVLEQVLETYSPHVKLVFKQFPLKMHKAAAAAAAAALVAHEQGNFWEFHSLMFENYRNLSQGEISKIAVELGFDKNTFEHQTKDIRILKKIQKDIAEGLSIGVRGVPKVYINGRPLKNRTREGFQSLIDIEMKNLGIQPATAINDHNQ